MKGSALMIALVAILSFSWAQAKEDPYPSAIQRALNRVLSIGSYVDPNTGRVDSQKYISDLQSLKGISPTLKLWALQELGRQGGVVWNSQNDGKPEANFDRAFYFAAAGIRSEDSNCVTTHAVLMFTAARELGLEPVALSGLWNSGRGGAGLHSTVLVRDPESGNFYSGNYFEMRKVEVDRSLSLNAQVAEASRKAQTMLGVNTSVKIGDSAVQFTKLGDLLSNRILNAQPGVAIEKLGDGTQATVIRQGNLIVAKVGTSDEGDLTFAGYSTHLGKLQIQSGLAWAENTPAPSERFVTGQFCYSSSRDLDDRVKIEGLAKIFTQINTHWASSPGGGLGLSSNSLLQGRALDRGGAQVDAMTQIVPRSTDGRQFDLPTRAAVSVGGKTSVASGDGILTFENRGGFFFASPNEIDRTSGAVFGASSRARWNQGRLTLGADLNYLSQGQGTRSAGLAYSLGASYQLKKNQELTFRLAGGTGPSDDPFNLENFIRPEYRSSSQPRFEFGYKTKW